MAGAVMHKIFVEAKVISAGDFDLCWTTPDLSAPPNGVIEPFIQMLADKGILPVGKSLEDARPTNRAWPSCRWKNMTWTSIWRRSFPAEICRRWCVLPFDRMSKSILVATANPFNHQAAKELAEATSQHGCFWYLAPPSETC